MFDLAVCQPPQIVTVRQAPAPPTTESVLDEVLHPLQLLREQFIATTGLGLDEVDGEEPGGATVTRHILREEALHLELSYLAAGDPNGRRVIFLHGSPGSADEWTAFLRAVPPGLEYVAIDRPGFGSTIPGDAVTELSRQAAALRPLLVPQGGAAPVLVGYSYGAPVALRAAIDMPGRVAGVLLVGGAVDPAEEDANVVQWLADLEMLSALLPEHLANANDELLALPDELPLLAADLPRIRVLVMALHGEDDTLAPIQNIAFLARHLPPAAAFRTVIVEEADHFLPWSHPQAVHRALACLLSSAATEDPLRDAPVRRSKGP